MATTNLGRVGFVARGTWAAGTYKYLDMVRYNTAAYVCKVATTTNNPSITSDWDLVVQDGISGAGTGDVVGPATAIDGEIALFNGATGELIKSATTTGLLKAASGVLGSVVSGKDIKTINSASILGAGDIALAALGANTFTGDQTGGDNDLIQWNLKDVSSQYNDKGTVVSGTVTFNYTDGPHQRLQVGGALTIATSTWPPSGTNGSMLVELVNGASATVTWPTVNWIKSDGTVTTTFSANGVTLQASGTDFFVLWTRDAGTTIYGKFVR